MQFRLLGATQAAVAGEFATIASPVQRCLLAVLLVNRNRTVSSDALIDAVWSRSAKGASRNTLQVHIGRLRELMSHVDGAPPPALTGTRTGYTLTVGPDQVDLDVFERLCACGRRAVGTENPRAVRLLSRALELWSGDPFGGSTSFGSIDMPAALVIESSRLAELHGAATGALVEAMLESGQPAEALALATAHSIRHPYEERSVELLMLAQYRAGRAVDALASYRDFARRLDAELGLEPAERLRDLERDILRRQSRRTPVGPSGPKAPWQLPVRDTPLFGRASEVADTGKLLTSGLHRIVSLIGPGGVGKTRLALAAADALAPSAFDSIAFVSLADVRSPELAMIDIAGALGADDGSGTDYEPSIERAVRGLRVLLVLDNMEHLPDLGTRVAAWVQATDGLTVLVTSRSPLRVRGEYEYTVAPLPVPAAADPANPALALLLDRAAATGSAFDLRDDPDEGAALVEISRRCEGIPLALELAATRLRIMTPQALAQSLLRPLTVLTTGDSDLPDRQRTLRAMVNWSYELMTPAEQTLLQELTVFAGGADVDAVARVCDPWGERPTLELLQGLAQHSMVVASRGGAGLRLGMLDTVRQYAAEKQSARSAASLRDRHARHYLDLAAQCRPHVAAAVPGHVVAMLLSEHANLRAALQYALTDRALIEPAAAAVVGAWGLWFAAGHITEGRRWATQVRAVAGDIDPVARAELLVAEGGLALYEADFSEAMALLEQARAVLSAHERHDWVARTFEAASTIHLLRGELPEAAATAKQGLDHALASGDAQVIGRAHFQTGSIAVAHEDMTGADEAFRRYLQAAARSGSARDIAVAYSNLAALAVLRADQGSADAYAAAALTAAADATSDPDYAFALEINGLVALAADRDLQGETFYRQALFIGLRAGHRYRVDRILNGLSAAVAPNAPADSVRLAAAAEVIHARHGGSPTWPALRRLYAMRQAAASARLTGPQRAVAAARGTGTTESALSAEARPI